MKETEIEKQLRQINARLGMVLAKLSIREPQICRASQRKAEEAWNRYRFAPGIGKQGRKNTFSDVFMHCRGMLSEYGITDAKSFRLAVRCTQRQAIRRMTKA